MSDVQERISSTMADKIVEALKEIEIEIPCVEIGEVDSECTEAVKLALKSEECQKVIQQKIVETIQAIDPKVAAERLSLTWGELLGEFLYKIVNTFQTKSKK